MAASEKCLITAQRVIQIYIVSMFSVLWTLNETLRLKCGRSGFWFMSDLKKLSEEQDDFYSYTCRRSTFRGL